MKYTRSVPYKRWLLRTWRVGPASRKYKTIFAATHHAVHAVVASNVDTVKSAQLTSVVGEEETRGVKSSEQIALDGKGFATDLSSQYFCSERRPYQAA